MGLRVEVDKANERLGKQIRNAEQSRVPIMAVVGEQEVMDNTLAIRSRKGRKLKFYVGLKHPMLSELVLFTEGDLGSASVDEILTQLLRATDLGEELLSLENSKSN